MPRLVSRRSRMGRGRRRMRGGAVMDWIRKAHSFIKKNKLVSRVAGALASGGVPYAKTVGSLASKIGYGKRKSGGSLRLAGGRLRRMRY